MIGIDVSGGDRGEGGGEVREGEVIVYGREGGEWGEWGRKCVLVRTCQMHEQLQYGNLPTYLATVSISYGATPSKPLFCGSCDCCNCSMSGL